MDKIITEKTIKKFQEHLENEEKSKNTMGKYLHDVREFATTQNGKPVTKEAVIDYKQHLIENGYAARSINSILASLNSLFSLLGWYDCRVKTLKIQRQLFYPEEKELNKAEYERLCQAAQSQHNERLNLILQTICGTGIRVSELPFITVEAVQRGEAIVNCKGKTRIVFLVKPLQKKLLHYILKQKIKYIRLSIHQLILRIWKQERYYLRD